MPDYSTIPTSALIMLAQQRLKRMRIHLPAETREQALFIHKHVRPAPPRKAKLHIKPVYDLCCVCYKPMTTGTLCDSLGRRHSYCEVK